MLILIMTKPLKKGKKQQLKQRIQPFLLLMLYFFFDYDDDSSTDFSRRVGLRCRCPHQQHIHMAAAAARVNTF